jgi:hypothetical protein
MRHLLFLLSLLLANTTPAQPAPNSMPDSVQRIDEVIVKNPKNAAVLSYDTVYERLLRFRESKLDRVAFKVKVTPKNPNVQQSDIRVALVNDEKSLPVKVDLDGSVELPLREEFYKTNAELISNQPKGSLNVGVNINITWSGGREIAYAEVEETVRQLQWAGKDLLGWFGYMLFFPSITSVDIPVQYKAANGQRLDIVRDGRVIQTFSADEKGLLKFRLDRRWSDWQPTLVFSEVPPRD